MPSAAASLFICVSATNAALRPAEATERAADRGVGVHAVRIDARVGYLVRPGDAQVEVPEHLVRRVVVPAGIEQASASTAVIRPSRVAAELGTDPAAVALVVTDDRLLAAPLAA